MSHRLVEVSPDRLEFRRSLWTMAMIGGPYGLAAGGVAACVESARRGNYGIALLFAAVAVVFGALAYFVGRRLPRKAVFDRVRGTFYRQGERDEPRPLAAIAGVQVVAEEVEWTQYHDGETHQRRYVAWELNVVLDDGNRWTVVDHVGRDRIRSEARRLAQWLGVPFLGN